MVVADNFYVATTANPGAPVWHVAEGLYAQGSHDLAIPAGTLADGSYQWWARGSDYVDGGLSPSQPCYFQIDNEPPTGAPVLKIGGTTLLSPTIVRVQYAQAPPTIQMSDPSDATDHISGFIYSFSSTPPANPPACGQSSGSGPSQVWTACGASGGVLNVSVTIPDGVSQLTVWATDIAYNYGPAKTITFTQYRDGDPGGSGHGWLTDYDPATPFADPPAHPATAPTTVPDGTATSTSATLTLDGATLTAANPLGPVSAGNRTVWGLHLPSGSSAHPETSAVPIDTQASFTAGAWVLPSGIAAGTVISQHVGANSGFRVGLDGTNKPQFCLGSGSQCVTSSLVVPAGQWAFVQGTWDKPGTSTAGTLQILVSLASSTGTAPTITPLAGTGVSAQTTGPIALGWAQSGGAPANQFVGDIAGAVGVSGGPGQPCSHRSADEPHPASADPTPAGPLTDRFGESAIRFPRTCLLTALGSENP